MVRISVDLPEDVAERLSRLASDQQSTPEALISGWTAKAVAARAELAAQTTEALADLAEGRDASHEEVMARLDAWAEELEARHGPVR